MKNEIFDLVRKNSKYYGQSKRKRNHSQCRKMSTHMVSSISSLFTKQVMEDGTALVPCGEERNQIEI